MAIRRESEESSVSQSNTNPRILFKGRHLGVPYQIIQEWPGSGLVWRILQNDHLGREIGWRQSDGAFYDTGDPHDHPEGALEWARTSVKRFIKKTVG